MCCVLCILGSLASKLPASRRSRCSKSGKTNFPHLTHPDRPSHLHSHSPNFMVVSSLYALPQTKLASPTHTTQPHTSLHKFPTSRLANSHLSQSSLQQAIYDHWLLFFPFQHPWGVLWVRIQGQKWPWTPHPPTHHPTPQAPQPKNGPWEVTLQHPSHCT